MPDFTALDTRQQSPIHNECRDNKIAGGRRSADESGQKSHHRSARGPKVFGNEPNQCQLPPALQTTKFSLSGSQTLTPFLWRIPCPYHGVSEAYAQAADTILLRQTVGVTASFAVSTETSYSLVFLVRLRMQTDVDLSGSISSVFLSCRLNNVQTSLRFDSVPATAHRL